MRKRSLISLAQAGLLAACLVAPAHADTDMFNSTDKKQTAKDFKPAPDKIKTSFGTLEFEGGAFPTEETVQKIYDEMDLQRATQAFMDFFPALSLYGIVKSQIRDFGFKSSSDVGVMADFMKPSENYLTGNDVTVYAFASIDLKLDGPTVVEIPPGMYGTANDAAFKYLTDFGVTGPDQGKGGKYLFLPPGYQGEEPEGYFVLRSPSYRIWAMMRGFGEVGNGDQAVQWFKERLKVYPLATGPREHTVTNASGMGANTLPPEDGSVFAMLNEIIQYEPSDLFSQELLGRLATLGIAKGKTVRARCADAEDLRPGGETGCGDVQGNSLRIAGTGHQILAEPALGEDVRAQHRVCAQRTQRHRRANPLALPGHRGIAQSAVHHPGGRNCLPDRLPRQGWRLPAGRQDLPAADTR